MATSSSTSKTASPHSPGASGSRTNTPSTTTSFPSPAETSKPQPSTPPSPPVAPTKPKPSSLYHLAIQVQDVDGELALAVELLDSDDPAKRQCGADLVEQFLLASQHSHQLLLDKSDRVAGYIDHLRGIADFRAKESKRLADLAAADRRRADSMAGYLTKILTTLNPGATQFSLPTHELRCRKSAAVVIDDELAIPSDYLRYPKPEPDKSAIKQAIKTGHAIPGAHVEQHSSWTIK